MNEISSNVLDITISHPFDDTSYASEQSDSLLSSANEVRLEKKFSLIRTIVAMPAYNEEAHIAEVITGAKQYADIVLVVDDGSYDNTLSIAIGLGAMVIHHDVNKGYGGALLTIFSTARELSAEELVIIDSDGQHDCSDIPRLLAELRNGNDVVIGSRFNGVRGEGIPLYRKVGMKVLDIATMLAGNNLTVTDSQSGFRAYGKRAIEAINIDAYGMSAGSEILIKISDNNFRVAEVPIRVRYDLEGTSSENPIAHGFGVLMNLAKLILTRRPLATFGIPGFLFFGAGIIMQIYQVINQSSIPQLNSASQLAGISITHFGPALIVIGMLLCTFGWILRYSWTRATPSSPSEDNDRAGKVKI